MHNIYMPATTIHTGRQAGERGAAMAATIVQSFRSFDRSTVHVLSDGRAVRESITGLMLLTAAGGQFVRYLDDISEVVGK